MILKMRMMVMMIFLYGDDGVDQDDNTNLPLPREPWLAMGSSPLVPAPPLHLLNLYSRKLDVVALLVAEAPGLELFSSKL